MKIEVTSCEDALRLLAAHLDGELHAPAERELERHLETCRTCFSRAEFERRLKKRLVAVGHEPVRPELTERVHTLIREFEMPSED